MNANINVCVISGLTFSGKSRMLKWLLEQPTLNDSPLIEMDKIRIASFGERQLCRTEHRYKNELTRQAIKNRAVIHRDPFIFSEMGMLSHEFHQQPLTDIILNANKYLKLICEERGLAPIQVGLRVILVFAHLPTVQKRVERRLREIKEARELGVDVFNLTGYADETSQVDFPITAYTPLLLDTTDECSERDDFNKNLALSFCIESRDAIANDIASARLAKLGNSYIKMRQEAMAYKP